MWFNTAGPWFRLRLPACSRWNNQVVALFSLGVGEPIQESTFTFAIRGTFYFAGCLLQARGGQGYSRNFASRVRFAIFIFPRTEPSPGERNAERTLSSDRILEASLACFIAQPQCDLLTSGAYAGSKCLGCVIS